MDDDPLRSHHRIELYRQPIHLRCDFADADVTGLANARNGGFRVGLTAHGARVSFLNAIPLPGALGMEHVVTSRLHSVTLCVNGLQTDRAINVVGHLLCAIGTKKWLRAPSIFFKSYSAGIVGIDRLQLRPLGIR